MGTTRCTLTLLFIAACGEPAITTDPIEPDRSDLEDDPAVIQARTYLEAYGWRAGLGADDDLEPTRVVRAGALDHVTFTRNHRGLAVLGGDLVVHGNPDRFAGFSAPSREIINLDLEPSITGDAAVVAARAAFSGTIDGGAPPRLVIDGFGEPRLAYEVITRGHRPDGVPSIQHVTIDADTGGLLLAWNEVKTEAGIGHSLYAGDVALDTTKGDDSRFTLEKPDGSIEVDEVIETDVFGLVVESNDLIDDDNEWGTGKHGAAAADRQSAAVDAFHGVETTRDLFSRLFGRDGMAGDGTGDRALVGLVDVTGAPVNNAYYFADEMVFGDGDGVSATPFVSLDIVGHEWAHGLTEKTAGLIYVEQSARGIRYVDSGGLNEATSDIFGTVVELHADNPQDPFDYLIGEEIKLDAPFSRDMRLPSRDSMLYPAPFRSWDCYSDDGFVGDDDVRFDPHFTSGPANRFFFLLSEGSAGAPVSPELECANTPEGLEIGGIGIFAAAKIWYVALTRYMTPRTTYPGARQATLRATRDLTAAGELDGSALQSVGSAWRTVNVKGRFLRGDSNGDGVIDISDAVFTLDFLFLGNETAECMDAADFNGDGAVDVSDAVGTLNWLFQGTDEPAGGDPEVCQLESALGCGFYRAEADVCAVSDMGVIDDGVDAAAVDKLRSMNMPELLAIVCPQGTSEAACQ